MRSHISTGQINHRTVCGNQFYVKDGAVSKKTRCHAHSCPVCSTVVWSSQSCGRIAVAHVTPSGKRCQMKHGHVPHKKAKKKGNEIERRCACRRNRWQWQNPCREAFERCESWQTEGTYAGTTDAMEANGGRQRSNNNKCLRPECLVEAAAKDFESFDEWKAGCNARTAKAYRHRVWWKLPGGSKGLNAGKRQA